MSMWDDEAGYDRTDPKHPGWRDGMAAAGDLARKREREGSGRASEAPCEDAENHNEGEPT